MHHNSAILISPYFLPSNLAGVQRVRLMSRALKNYGWTPTVVTVEPNVYEEKVDYESLRLLPKDLEIERVAALPAKLCRLFGIGDVSLRAQWALRRRVAELMKAERRSIIFATVLPGCAGAVGSWAKQRFKIPFVLDYQDPWVAQFTERKSPWSKAAIARQLATKVEMRMLPHVDAVTAVSDETLDSLRARGLLRPDMPITIIPIGADREDHAIASQYGHSLIEREEGHFHIAYLGTLTKRMLPSLKAFLAALRTLDPSQLQKLRIHLIGTSGQPAGQDQHNLGGLLEQFGLTRNAQLHPARIGYLDALRTMQDTNLLLLVGSTDSHYTASKLFPYWLSGKRVMALFHERSTIVSLAHELGGVDLLLYDNRSGPASKVAETAQCLSRIISGEGILASRNERAFERYSADGIACQFARVFERVDNRCA